MKKLVPMLLVAVCLLAGCTGANRFGNVEQEMAEYAGKITLEDAIDRWDEPSSISEGELLTVAYWEHKRSSGIIIE